MLYVFFFLLSLVMDYDFVGDIAHRAFVAGIVSAGVLSLAVARLVFHSREGR